METKICTTCGCTLELSAFRMTTIFIGQDRPPYRSKNCISCEDLGVCKSETKSGKKESDTYSKEVFDGETGQSLNLSHTSMIESKYYNIKKLNARICIMYIGTAQAKICKSSKDIVIFWTIMDRLDKYNEFRTSLADLAKELGVARSKVTGMFSSGIDAGIFKRVDRGVYKANPFMVKSKGSTNDTIEAAQSEWESL